MNRRPVVGFSLKNYINTNLKTRQLSSKLNELCGQETAIEQFLLPSLGTIDTVAQVLANSQIGFGSQNIAPKLNGAMTGEYSLETLMEVGGHYVELGHNERLNIFHETPVMINQKVRLVLDNQLVPVLCLGDGNTKLSMPAFTQKLKKQLTAYLTDVKPQQAQTIIFAYEPGWAIGKKQAADANYVHEAHHIIRDILKNQFGSLVAQQARIIYGGSISKESTPDIVNSDDVDGVFVGRFGHDPANYQTILNEVRENKK